ncbi:MAG TPA: hypothetical protein VKY27_06325 [Bacteriovoracaceae bacterium]|nr:hypothetical protein [Bacteriovoracaceae bacterium]
MKYIVLSITSLLLSYSCLAQVWATLPKGVRAIGYRNVQTSEIKNNFNKFGSENPLGAQFRVDAGTFNEMIGNVIRPGQDITQEAYDSLVVGEYKVDAGANVKVHGFGFGYGLTDRVTLYGQMTYYEAHVKSRIKRTAGNTYAQTADLLDQSGGLQNAFISENLRNMIDANEGTIQSVITNHFGYKPIGNWHGKGLGDIELGAMTKVIDKSSWGLMLYPGVTLPTGMEDDPDILQDIAFGDGQYDFFGELATGYIFNDKFSVGTIFRYTYQAPMTKNLRVPTDQDFTLASEKEKFKVKYGDRLNLALTASYNLNDWIILTPTYRYMYQFGSKYDSLSGKGDEFLSYNTEKAEHQAQMTVTLSSITPFLKKKFLLPAQIHFNSVHVVAGKNVPKMSRFEVEFRMLF